MAAGACAAGGGGPAALRASLDAWRASLAAASAPDQVGRVASAAPLMVRLRAAARGAGGGESEASSSERASDDDATAAAARRAVLAALEAVALPDASLFADLSGAPIGDASSSGGGDDLSGRLPPPAQAEAHAASAAAALEAAAALLWRCGPLVLPGATGDLAAGGGGGSGRRGGPQPLPAFSIIELPAEPSAAAEAAEAAAAPGAEALVTSALAAAAAYAADGGCDKPWAAGAPGDAAAALLSQLAAVFDVARPASRALAREHSAALEALGAGGVARQELLAAALPAAAAAARSTLLTGAGAGLAGPAGAPPADLSAAATFGRAVAAQRVAWMCGAAVRPFLSLTIGRLLPAVLVRAIFPPPLQPSPLQHSIVSSTHDTAICSPLATAAPTQPPQNKTLK